MEKQVSLLEAAPSSEHSFDHSKLVGLCILLHYQIFKNTHESANTGATRPAIIKILIIHDVYIEDRKQMTAGEIKTKRVNDPRVKEKSKNIIKQLDQRQTC